MKKLAILALSLALVGCNTDGFKELPTVYARDHGGGGSKGFPTSGNNPSNPGSTNNTNSSNWIYSATTDNQGRTFVTRATTTSINKYKDSGGTPYSADATLKKSQYTDNAPIEKSVSLYGYADMPCASICKVKVRSEVIQEFDMINDGTIRFITGANSSINNQLYDLFAKGGTVQVELPIKNAEGNSFNAQFNARGFDPERMKLSSEGGKVASSTSP